MKRTKKLDREIEAKAAAGGDAGQERGVAIASRFANTKGLEAKQRNLVVPPGDPTFFYVMRLLQVNQEMKNPYVQHVWSHAAIQSVAKPISGIPFCLYRSVSEADESKDKGLVRRGVMKLDPGLVRERASALRGVLRGLGDGLVESIARIPHTRRRFFATRQANTLAVLKGVGQVASPSQLSDAVGGLEPVYDGPWVEALERVNPLATSTQLWEETIIHLRSRGRAFWILDTRSGGVIAPNEAPYQIWVKGPDGWSVEKLNPRTGEVLAWKYKFKVAYKGDFREIVTPYLPHQVVMFKYIHPDNMLDGLGNLDVAKNEIMLDFYAQQFNTNFFKRGAVIGGVLTVDEGMTTEQEQQLQTEFDGEHAGFRNAHSTAVLSGGVKWIPNTATQRDMEHGKTREFARDAALAAQRTSRSAIGLAEDHNKANQESAQKAHWEVNLIPEMAFLESVVNGLVGGLFSEERVGKGNEIIWGAFDLSVVPSLREDMRLKLRIAKEMSDRGWTANQINEKLDLGMPRVPWGDTWYRPINTAPVNAKEEDNAVLATGTPKPPAPKPGPGGPGDGGKGKPGAPGGAGGTVDGDGDGGSGGGGDDGSDASGEKPAGQSGGGPGAAGATLGTPEHWQRVARTVLEPGEQDFRAKWRRFVTSVLRAEQLSRIPNSGIETLDEVRYLLFDAEVQAKEAAAYLDPVYARVAGMATDEAEAEVDAAGLGPAPFLGVETHRDIIEQAKDTIALAVASIHSQLGEVLGAAFQEQGKLTSAQVKDLVRAVFNRVTTAHRLTLVAANEVARTVSIAREEVFRAAGVKWVKWLKSGGEGADRSTHQEYADRGAVEFGASFSSGFLIRGPHDAQAPVGERLGCWCLIYPVAGPE